jgi:hypothetical protein
MGTAGNPAYLPLTLQPDGFYLAVQQRLFLLARL